MIKVKRYLGNQCLTSIYYSLIYPYFYMVAYWQPITAAYIEDSKTKQLELLTMFLYKIILLHIMLT